MMDKTGTGESNVLKGRLCMCVLDGEAFCSPDTTLRFFFLKKDTAGDH